MGRMIRDEDREPGKSSKDLKDYGDYFEFYSKYNGTLHHWRISRRGVMLSKLHFRKNTEVAV